MGQEPGQPATNRLYPYEAWTEDIRQRVRGGETVFRERIFLPGRKNPLLLPGNDPLLLLLMRIRDEAHRFALRFHRGRRARESFR